jgi:hypothetical protein
VCVYQTSKKSFFFLVFYCDTLTFCLFVFTGGGRTFFSGWGLLEQIISFVFFSFFRTRNIGHQHGLSGRVSEEEEPPVVAILLLAMT